MGLGFRNSYLKIKNKTAKKWPIVPYIDYSPTFIFLLTPPYSGSTAIAKTFLTSDKVTSLTDNAEGQWLIKGMCDENRWDLNKNINNASIKSIWLREYNKKKKDCPNLNYIIEKSPPNIIRIHELIKIFPKYILIANNRNPYAFCASSINKINKYKDMNNYSKNNVLEKIISTWVMVSENIIKLNNSNLDIINISYETFSDTPRKTFELIKKNNELSTLSFDVDSKIKVKKYKPQKIRNFNAEQISLLNSTEIKFINNFLNKHKELMNYFHYDFIY